MTLDQAAAKAILYIDEQFKTLDPEERIRAHAIMMQYHQSNVAKIELSKQKTVDISNLI